MRTMAEIQRAAFRLFAEQGFDATTVEQIAAAADVSPATFFRYFRSKSDLLERDEFDPLLAETFVNRPAEEDLLTAFQETLRTLLPLIEERDLAGILERTRLLSASDRLNAQLWKGMRANIDALAAAIAERTGADPGSLRVRVQAAAMVSAQYEVLLAWAAEDGRANLFELVDRSLDHLRFGSTPSP